MKILAEDPHSPSRGYKTTKDMGESACRPVCLLHMLA